MTRVSHRKCLFRMPPRIILLTADLGWLDKASQRRPQLDAEVPTWPSCQDQALSKGEAGRHLALGA